VVAFVTVIALKPDGRLGGPPQLTRELRARVCRGRQIARTRGRRSKRTASRRSTCALLSGRRQVRQQRRTCRNRLFEGRSSCEGLFQLWSCTHLTSGAIVALRRRLAIPIRRFGKCLDRRYRLGTGSTSALSLSEGRSAASSATLPTIRRCRRYVRRRSIRSKRSSALFDVSIVSFWESNHHTVQGIHALCSFRQLEPWRIRISVARPPLPVLFCTPAINLAT